MHQRNALVTGGLRGIGRVIAETFCARGDHVFVFDYVDSQHEDVISLTATGITYLQVDVSSHSSITDGFSLLPSSLDILVNNAGITRDGLALRLSESDWDAVLDVNLKGAFSCSQHALKRMIKQNKSYIINIASIVGIHGNAGQANYAASKAGIIALTKTLAQEYGSRNVLVNAIAPGFISTPMTEKLPETVKQRAREMIPLKRFGTPDDVAQVVAFLSSGNADYVTGAVIEVAGGM